MRPATPVFDLRENERLIATYRPNRVTYIREHVMLAAIGAVLLSGLLIALGNPHAWTGIVGSVLAIGARGAYAMSEQLAMTWALTDQRLIAPDGRSLALPQVANARSVFSAVQIITTSGDKYLMKYMADTATPVATILAQRSAGAGRQ